MEKDVEKLIQSGIKSARKERILCRKLIEAHADYNQELIDYLTSFYQECTYNTDSIIVELLTKKNISSSMEAECIQNAIKSADDNALTFWTLFSEMKSVLNYSKLTSDYENIYCKKNSIMGENVMFHLNASIEHLRNNKFENAMSKKRFLTLLIHYVSSSPATRQFFKGKIELASSFCTPELYYDKDEICSMIRSLTNVKLASLVDIFTPEIFFSFKNGDKMTKDLCLQLKIGLIADFMQCESHGVELELEDYTDNPFVLDFLHSAKESAKQLLNEKNKLLKINNKNN